MEFLYLVLFLVLLIFVVCAFVGVIRFLSDTKKFSSYKQELDKLLKRAELVDDASTEGEEVTKID